MTSLVKSKERVSEHGEVFTPPHIVSEMHNLLAKKNWADKTLVYLEPTCGNGQFLVDAVKRKMEAGLSPEQAVNTTFGMDIMKDNIEDSRLRVLGVIIAFLKAKKKAKKGLPRIAAIIVHNIFQVKESIDFMSKGEMFDNPTKWECYPFLYVDPTGEGMVLKGKKAKEAAGKALLERWEAQNA